MPEVQLVLSAGKNVNFDDLGPVPSNTIIVSVAPQIELLKRATLCITHAGLNTAMESLAQGVPMVAIPIGYDQPGVASRIAYHGAGEVVQIEDLTVERLAELVQRVRTKPSYREKAQYFQKVIAETRGLDLAAEVIEEALVGGVFQQLAERPVTVIGLVERWLFALHRVLDHRRPEHLFVLAPQSQERFHEQGET